MWFKELMGFEEISPENVKNNTYIDGEHIISKINGKSYQFGQLEIPTLNELRDRSKALESFNGKLQLNEVVGNVQALHCNRENENAFFQAASQFNLLEMVGPDVIPESGVDIYEYDYTQGPACAIACGAGTIYRNYFAPVNGKIGQTSANQINCLDEIGKQLNNKELNLWQMRNGYALPTQEGLLMINKEIAQLTNDEKELLKGKLKIGVQWNTEVTLVKEKQRVSQAYCSALPVSYSNVDFYYWEDFARIILEGTYEATLYASLENMENTGCNKVFLTLVGGGAFGNELNWILESMLKALIKFKNTPLDVKIVSYGRSNNSVQKLLKEYK